MFDQSDDLFSKVLGAKSVHWTLITIFIIIVISSLSSTFGQSLLSQQVGADEVVSTNYSDVDSGSSTSTTTTSTTASSGSFGDNVLMTIVNPRVLGMILLLIIGIFTIIFMADSQS